MDPADCLPGTRVRLCHAPDRTGVLSDHPPRTAAGKVKVQVKFDSGTATWTRVANLEPLAQSSSPFDDVQLGSFHPVSTLRRQLLHEKLHGRLSNILYSMDTSETKFYAYQFKPVFKLIESPTSGILIADEVGLGKTIETGLIWTELRARSGARNLLVVCPPHLRIKWREELSRRFGVKARVAKAGEVEEELRQWQADQNHTFALIASYHSLRPPKNWREEDPRGHRNSRLRLAHLFLELATCDRPPIDLLAMDEVHYMRNQKTATSHLGELLCPVAVNRVFLSATPIHTENENLFSLLRLLDPDTYDSVETFRSILEANVPLVELRDLVLKGQHTASELLERVVEAAKNSMLRGSRTLAQIRQRLEGGVDLEDPEHRSRIAYQLERANLLGNSVTRSRKRDVFENVVQRNPETLSVEMHPLEKELYDHITEIVDRYAEHSNLPSGFLSVMPQRQIASCPAAALERWIGDSYQWGNEDSLETPDDLPEKSGRPLIDYIRNKLPRHITPAELERVDSKFDELSSFLTSYWRKNDGKKIVLFAHFRLTLRYLERRLRDQGIHSLILQGGMTAADGQSDPKMEVIREFRESSEIDILLSSEVGGEGLDLQFAGTLINYDLPWNPMVVEQRIGRIDRIGQEADRILIVNLICKGTVDERIYDRLYLRLNLFQRALGDLGAVLGNLVSQLERDLLSHQLTKEQRAKRIEDTELALAEKLRTHEEMEQQAGVLAAYGDFILQQVNRRHERQLWIHSGDIESFVNDFFSREFPKTRLQGIDQSERRYEIEPDSDFIHHFETFLDQKSLRGETRVTGFRKYSIVFEHRTYKKVASGTEVIHQSHPLIRFACDWLRRERRLNPDPVAIRLQGSKYLEDLVAGNYGFVVQRWTVEGLRVDERLTYHAVNFDSGKRVSGDLAEQLAEEATSRGSDWPSARDELPDEALSVTSEWLQRLDEEGDDEFSEYEEQCQNENSDRSSIQLNAIQRFRERRFAVLQDVLRKHREAGRNNLIAATEGLIREHMGLCDSRKLSIEAKSKIVGEYQLIAIGMIQLTKQN